MESNTLVLLCIDITGKLIQIPTKILGFKEFSQCIPLVIFGAVINNNGKIWKIENMPSLLHGDNSGYLKKPNPLSSELKIWRYMEYWKFEDMLKRNSHYLSRLDTFEDKSEGITPESYLDGLSHRTELTSQQKVDTKQIFRSRMNQNCENGFISCWHINEQKNPKMWKEYTNNKPESIVIESTVGQLTKSFTKFQNEIRMERVWYYEEPIYLQQLYWFPFIFKKRKYEWENELRFGIFFTDEQFAEGKPNHTDLPVNLDQLITKIHLSQYSTNEFLVKVQSDCNKYGLNKQIVK